jgi:hypothetical protein
VSGGIISDEVVVERSGGKYEAIGSVLFAVGFFAFLISLFAGKYLGTSTTVLVVGLVIFLIGRFK